MSSFICCLMYPILYSVYTKPLGTLNMHALSYIWFFARALPPAGKFLSLFLIPTLMAVFPWLDLILPCLIL